MMWNEKSFQFVTRQGDTFNPQLPIRDQNGGVVDPDGWEAVYRLIETAGSESIVLERKLSTGGIVTDFDAARGLHYLQPVISKEDSASLTPGRYRCELRITDAAGNRGTAATGVHIIERQFARE